MLRTVEGEDGVPYASFDYYEEPGFAQPPVFGNSSVPVEPAMRAPIDHEADYGDPSPRSQALASIAPKATDSTPIHHSSRVLIHAKWINDWRALF